MTERELEHVVLNDPAAFVTDNATPSRRQSSLLKKSSRRSTILSRNANQSEPVIGNPNNTPQANEQLRKEYETVKTMNHVLSTALKNFEEASDRIHQFSETINVTDQLLDQWLSILEKTEEIRSYVENSSITAKEEARAFEHNGNEDYTRRPTGLDAVVARAKEVDMFEKKWKLVNTLRLSITYRTLHELCVSSLIMPKSLEVQYHQYTHRFDII